MLEHLRKTLTEEADSLVQRAMMTRSAATLLTNAIGRATPASTALLKSALRNIRKAGEMYLIAGFLADEETLRSSDRRR